MSNHEIFDIALVRGERQREYIRRSLVAWVIWQR